MDIVMNFGEVQCASNPNRDVYLRIGVHVVDTDMLLVCVEVSVFHWTAIAGTVKNVGKD
jgi:hypothetical protein